MFMSKKKEDMRKKLNINSDSGVNISGILTASFFSNSLHFCFLLNIFQAIYTLNLTNNEILGIWNIAEQLFQAPWPS